MPFERLTESFYDHQLTLPVTLPDGTDHDYVIPSPDSETGQFVQRVVLLAASAARGDEITDEDRAFLNDAPAMDSEELLDLMLTAEVRARLDADKVPWPMYQKILGTTEAWIAFGRDAAQEFWNRREEETPKAQPQDRKATAKKAPAKKASPVSSPRKRSGNPAKRAATAGSNSTDTGRSSKRTSTSSTV